MIDFERFNRMLSRCEEIASEEGMKQSVTRVYTEVLRPAATPFLTADASVTAATSLFNAKSASANTALGNLDKPYQEARAVAFAFVRGIVLPETLKAQPTDTDKINAITKLVDVLTTHKTEPWAEEQLQGSFGTQAPTTVAEIRACIAAAKTLAAARADRQAAYPAAHEAFLDFKKVVRTGLGAQSKQYQRINLREAPAKPTKDQAGKGAPGPAKNGSKPVEPAKPAEPAKPVEPAKPAEPAAGPVTPVADKTPDNPVEPTPQPG